MISSTAVIAGSSEFLNVQLRPFDAWFELNWIKKKCNFLVYPKDFEIWNLSTTKFPTTYMGNTYV